MEVWSRPQDSSGVASLFVEYESGLLPHLPFPLHTSDQCLVFALQPRSKSHRAFFSKVKAAPAADGAALYVSESNDPPQRPF